MLRFNKIKSVSLSCWIRKRNLCWSRKEKEKEKQERKAPHREIERGHVELQYI